jgi:hypothetical protein
LTREGSIKSDLNLTKGKSGTLVVAIVDLKGAFVLACFAFFLLGQVTLTPARIGRMATGQVVGCRLPIFATATIEKYF